MSAISCGAFSGGCASLERRVGHRIGQLPSGMFCLLGGVLLARTLARAWGAFGSPATARRRIFDFVGGMAICPVEVRQRNEHVDTAYIHGTLEKFDRLVNLQVSAQYELDGSFRVLLFRLQQDPQCGARLLGRGTGAPARMGERPQLASGHGEKKQNVIAKLSAFYERFFGLSSTGH